MAATALKAPGIAFRPWKPQIHLTPQARVQIIPAKFHEFLKRLPVRIAAPERPQLGERIREFWSSTPAWSRFAAPAAVVAALCMVPGRHAASGKMEAASQAIRAQISRRAAIELEDDFRSGLGRWTGDGQWANTWSYDATGFARPGKLALLARSLPLTDYRLEFLVQVEKRGLGWCFRVADARNYYATRLLESKRGAQTEFSIVHYALIGGSQRFKIQLPVPVSAGRRTLLHIRQEVRGAQFTTYLDDQVVDTWSDGTLARGGIGFFAEPGEAAYIRWVQVAQNDDLLGRFCSLMAPGDQK